MRDSKFLANLRALARMTNRELPPEAFELFASLVLEPYGEEVSQAALVQFVRGTARGFPMPGELVALIEGPKLSPKQIAGDVAARMLGMISRRGYAWTDTYRYDGHESFDAAVRTELGEEAIAVLDLCGGWRSFCQQFDEGVNGNARPQLRDLVEAQIVRGQMQAHHARLGQSRDKPLLAVVDSARKELRAQNAERESVDPGAARAEIEKLRARFGF